LPGTPETGAARELSAHLFGSAISIGSGLSQKTHFNSVRPVKLGAGTILLPQRKQRVTRSIATLPVISTLTSRGNLGSNGELQIRPRQ